MLLRKAAGAAALPSTWLALVHNHRIRARREREREEDGVLVLVLVLVLGLGLCFSASNKPATHPTRDSLVACGEARER